MNKRVRWIGSLVLITLTLAACGAGQAQTSAPLAAQTSVPTTTPQAAADTVDAAVVSGTGEIKAVRDVNLAFTVPGIVGDVKVGEGDTVQKGQLLAILDTRPLDERIEQAQAALNVAIAQQGTAAASETNAAAAQTGAAAQRAALTDAPKPAAVQAANAQVEAARVNVAQARNGQDQDIRTAQANLAAVQATLQTTRDKLSAVKTQSDTAVQQSADALTQAQANYAQAKSNWDYVQQTGKDPGIGKQPDPKNPGKTKEVNVTEVASQRYYATFVQAEAALHSAEDSVKNAQVTADNAHQAEITGVEAAQQGVNIAQATLDKLQVPETEDRVAAAQAGLAAAQANATNLYPDARSAQKKAVEAAAQQAEAAQQQADAAAGVAEAGVAAAQVALKQAQTNREYAELHAPFDAVVVAINIDPGAAAGQPTSGTAIRLLDVSKLRFEAQISDSAVAQIAVGQKARVRLDSMPETPLTGTVSYVASEATIAGTSRTYVVRVTLDTQKNLRAGMSGQVDFLKQ